MTIYEIKQLTQETSPYFFSRNTLKFFNQKMRGFSVIKQQDGRYKISQSMKDSQGKIIGQAIRFFNPSNNELERA